MFRSYGSAHALSLFVSCFCLLLTSAAAAQIPDVRYGMGIREPGTNPCVEIWCGEEGNECLCNIAVGVPDVGTYEVLIYGSEYNDQSGLRFALELPEGWNVLSYSLCEGVTLDAGNPLSPSDGIEITTADCWDWLLGQFMTLLVECPTPGNAFMVPWPSEGGVMERNCSGEWRFADEPNPRRINVGDFCGRLEQSGPCDYCMGMINAEFAPSQLTWSLSPGTSSSQDVTVNGRREYCPDSPECGWEGHPADCFLDLMNGPTWLAVQWVESPFSFRHIYELTADADGYAPGVYQGRVESTTNCTGCQESCFDVEMTVLGPADAETPEVAGLFGIQAAPNPAVDGVSYRLAVPRDGRVRVSLFSAAGRLEHVLMDRDLPAGEHQVEYARDLPVASGTYFLEARIGDEVTRNRLTIVGR